MRLREWRCVLVVRKKSWCLIGIEPRPLGLEGKHLNHQATAQLHSINITGIEPRTLGLEGKHLNHQATATLIFLFKDILSVLS
uniref:hypothetical protein n=1 Tax=Salmonella sp. s51090 TaxID=3159651 RepID=UPI0039815511